MAWRNFKGCYTKTWFANVCLAALAALGVESRHLFKKALKKKRPTHSSQQKKMYIKCSCTLNKEHLRFCLLKVFNTSAAINMM
jgi:hypothetical protein